MAPLPIFLSVGGRRCLVVGGGRVGQRRALALAGCGADVLVIDPAAPPALLAAASATPGLRVETRPWRAGDADGFRLVFACTDVPAVNEAVQQDAETAGALCSRADGGGDFSLGAVLDRGDLCVAVSSRGAGPHLAVAARDRIAGVIGDEYAEAARLMALLRRRLREDVADAALRGEALRGAIDGGLLEMLRDGRPAEAVSLLDRLHEQASSACGESAAQGVPCTR